MYPHELNNVQIDENIERTIEGNVMANRPVDLLIAYRVIKMLVTPFDKQPAFKYGIIDKDGKVLKKYNTIKGTLEKRSYTVLHRFVFNLKRLLAKAGIKGKLGSFAVAAALLLRENKEILQYIKKQLNLLLLHI